MSHPVNIGASGTFGSAGGQRIYAYNTITTSPQQVAGLNPQRQSITFHNPGVNDLYVAPAVVQTPGTGSDVVLTPSAPNALGGCFLVLAGNTIKLVGEIAKPWQAFTAAAGNNPLTVMDSNVTG